LKLVHNPNDYPKYLANCIFPKEAIEHKPDQVLLRRYHYIKDLLRLSRTTVEKAKGVVKNREPGQNFKKAYIIYAFE
jgi:hypothetical protein